MIDWPWEKNVIPYIKGEEYKTNEPLKILARLTVTIVVKTLKKCYLYASSNFSWAHGIGATSFSKKNLPNLYRIYFRKFKTDDLIPIYLQPQNLQSLLKTIDASTKIRYKYLYDSDIGRIEEDKFFDYRFIGLSTI